MVEWLFLAVPWGCMRFVIVAFPDHTGLLFLWHFLPCALVLFIGRESKMPLDTQLNPSMQLNKSTYFVIA